MTNIGLLALAPLFGSAGADQQTVLVDGTPTIHLSLAGLDLTQAGDRRVVDEQIRKAVRSVCSERFDPGAGYRENVACVQSSLTDARRQLRVAVNRSAERDHPILASIAVTISSK